MNVSLLRRFLNSACRIFTVCALLLCMIQLATATDSADVETVISPFSFIMLFPFALCLACAGIIRGLDKISSAAGLAAHFVLTTAGACLFIFLPAGVFAASRTALVILFAYLIVYVLAMLVSALIRSAAKRSLEEESSRK